MIYLHFKKDLQFLQVKLDFRTNYAVNELAMKWL